MTDWDKPEDLHEDEDDGTIVENVATLREAVVGHKIVSVEQKDDERNWRDKVTVLTLDDGTQVEMFDEADCCAYTELKDFFLHPESVRHVITDVRTTDGYTNWHILADFGDVMTMKVGWSCGNPFYYAYGFDIRVKS